MPSHYGEYEGGGAYTPSPLSPMDEALIEAREGWKGTPYQTPEQLEGEEWRRLYYNNIGLGPPDKGKITEDNPKYEAPSFEGEFAYELPGPDVPSELSISGVDESTQLLLDLAGSQFFRREYGEDIEVL